jgi:hypothetical protein
MKNSSDQFVSVERVMSQSLRESASKTPSYGGGAAGRAMKSFVMASPTRWRLLTRWFVVLPLASLSACVYVPITTAVYDEGCQVMSREMHLEPVQMGAIRGCSNEGCALILVALGATAAATAVISGSIVVAGNVVYWFEKQGSCRRGREQMPS